MHTHHALPPAPHERSIARDRAVLALASALCGAIAAAGVAAVAIAGQLHTRQQQTAMQQATDALEGATQNLTEARRELAAARADAATCAAPPPPVLGPRAITAGAPGGATMITHVGVRCPGEHHCQVHREVIAGLLEDPVALSRAARVVPAYQDGEARGLKLYGLRGGSVLRLLGLRNGDLVVALDGAPLRSLDQAMAAFAALRQGGPVVHVDIERRGEALRKRFEIL